MAAYTRVAYAEAAHDETAHDETAHAEAAHAALAYARARAAHAAAAYDAAAHAETAHAETTPQIGYQEVMIPSRYHPPTGHPYKSTHIRHQQAVGPRPKAEQVAAMLRPPSPPSYGYAEGSPPGPHDPHGPLGPYIPPTSAKFRSRDRVQNRVNKKKGIINYLRDDQYERNGPWKESPPKYRYYVNYDDGSSETYEREADLIFASGAATAAPTYPQVPAASTPFIVSPPIGHVTAPGSQYTMYNIVVKNSSTPITSKAPIDRLMDEYGITDYNIHGPVMDLSAEFTTATPPSGMNMNGQNTWAFIDFKVRTN